MDREKLDTAAIIAAARYDNPFDEPAYDKKFYDVFKAGTDWLMQQPLSERLTEEEKEKIIKKYKFNDEAGLATAIRTGEMANKYILKRDLLEDIFGEKLFNDK